MTLCRDESFASKAILGGTIMGGDAPGQRHSKMLQTLVTFFNTYAVWVAACSVTSLVIGVLTLPFLVTRIPADYFSHEHRHRILAQRRNPFVRLLLAGIKNAVGALLVFAGLLMLVLPGQGLLTLAAGLMIMNYPGKYSLERWLIMRPYVLPAINKLRRRYNVPSLESPKAGD